MRLDRARLKYGDEDLARSRRVNVTFAQGTSRLVALRLRDVTADRERRPQATASQFMRSAPLTITCSNDPSSANEDVCVVPLKPRRCTRDYGAARSRFIDPGDFFPSAIRFASPQASIRSPL